MKQAILHVGLSFALLSGSLVSSLPASAFANAEAGKLQLPDAQVLAQAIVQGKLAAVETYAATYRPDLNQAIAIRPDLSLRPLSLALTHLRYQERSQLSAFTPLATEKEMLKLLLKLNANPNYHEPDLGQATPLHLVFDLPADDQVDLLEILFDYQGEASLSALDSQQRNPLELAQQKKSPVANWLSKYAAKGLLDYQIRYAPFALASGQASLSQLAQQQTLINAFQKNQREKLADLLTVYSPDIYLIDGQPLLHELVRRQAFDYLVLWQKANANFDLPDLTGQSAMHLAASLGLPRMIDALRLAGASINLRDQERNTPLHLAVLQAQPESVRKLLQARARWDLPNLAGQNAWQLAQERWRSDPATYGELYLIFQTFVSRESLDVSN